VALGRLPRLEISNFETFKYFLFEQLYFSLGFFLEVDTLFPLTYLLPVLEVHLSLQVRFDFWINFKDVFEVLHLQVAGVLNNLEPLGVIHK